MKRALHEAARDSVAGGFAVVAAVVVAAEEFVRFWGRWR